MLNPFLQFPPEKANKSQAEMNEEAAAQINNAKPVRKPSRQKNLGLWTGNLLIKMGKKLAEQDIELKTSKEHA